MRSCDGLLLFAHMYYQGFQGNATVCARFQRRIRGCFDPLGLANVSTDNSNARGIVGCSGVLTDARRWAVAAGKLAGHCPASGVDALSWTRAFEAEKHRPHVPAPCFCSLAFVISAPLKVHSSSHYSRNGSQEILSDAVGLGSNRTLW